MASPKITNVTLPDSRASSITDRLAFDPFTSKEEILNDLIKNIINPDLDANRIYYVGYVCEIIDMNDQEIDVRDIFYSPSENYERISKPISTKAQDKKILLVHIPSFTTNGEINIGSKLNYNSFNKIRVEYDRKETVKVGNVVKIQFRDKNSFYNPFVVDPPIDTSFQDISPHTKKASEEFLKHTECKLLNIKIPKTLADIDFTSINSPAGGYTQALDEINYVFSNAYISSFIRTIAKEPDIGKIENIIIKLEKISLGTPVYTEFGQLKSYSSFSILPLDLDEYKGKPEYDILKEDYHIFCLEENIKISGQNPQKIKNLFYKFIQKDFDIRLGYSFSFDDQSNNNFFRVDLNLNQLLKTSAKKVEDYISISKKLKDSTTFYSFIKPPSPENSANPQILKSKTVSDKCDSEIAKNKTTYKLVYEKNKPETEGLVATQNEIIKNIFNQKIKPDSFLNIDYFYQLFGTTKQEAKNFLITKNEDFYIESGTTNDNYNLPAELKNTLNVSDLEDRFNFIIKFLKQLKDLLTINEGYRDYPDSIYIIPFNVLEIRKKQAISEKYRDRNSRHFYGKAFDIFIFIRDEFSEGVQKRVVQIPPEIVALYIDAVSKIMESKYIIGQGMYLQNIFFYNHVEFIDQDYSGLKQEQVLERILFTGATTKDSGTDLEKSIEKIPAGSARIEKLKEIVRQGSNYISPITKQLDPRFEVLV